MAGDECAGGGSLWVLLGESVGAGGWRWWWASSGEPATGVRCLSRGEAMCVGGTCAGGATWATLGGRRGELREVITWACPPLTALSRAGAGVGACRVSMARSGQVRRGRLGLDEVSAPRVNAYTLLAQHDRGPWHSSRQVCTRSSSFVFVSGVSYLTRYLTLFTN